MPQKILRGLMKRTLSPLIFVMEDFDGFCSSAGNNGCDWRRGKEQQPVSVHLLGHLVKEHVKP